MKLNTKQIRDLIASGCPYDEATHLVQAGARIKRVEAKHTSKRKAKDEGKHNRP